EPRSDPGSSAMHVSAGSGGKRFGGLHVKWRTFPRKGGRKTPRLPPGREVFDADKIGLKVVLRHWRRGDRFQPIGMQQSVKLQDLFTNLKIPRARRHQLVVATTAHGELFWIEGVRMGERFKLDHQTRRCLEWKWRRESVVAGRETA
ncbi:MAG TPA: tRNA lysidine(34) synthetase TilS, partial [Verrucomicrobiae bacterium]|nr:tRNA lysidine(34) synthetase TilS [Verrucomicrobiae bacterium]